MEYIKTYVEQLIQLFGLTGQSVSVARHIFIVLVIALLAWLCDFICRKVFMPLVLKITSKTDVSWDDVIFNTNVLTSACHIIPALIVYSMLPIAFYDIPALLEILLRISEIYITLTTVKLLLVFFDSLKDLKHEKRSSKQQYLVTFCGVLKIIVIFVAIIVIVGIIINKSPMTLFAGLGATATILMFVFKDTLVGLVSGIRLTSNDMLHKGDWITFPKAGANGIVEEVSITTVKVRNFDNTIITIPPSTLVNDSFQNWIGMQKSKGRRVNRQLFFDFRSIGYISDKVRENLISHNCFTEDELKGDLVNMTLFRQFVEKFLAGNETVNNEMLIMVRILEAPNSGLPVEFYFFLKNKEWKLYEHDMAAIMEEIFALVPFFGLKIYQQYPEQ